MLNNATLIGRLTRDPELRLAGDKSTVSATIAVQRDFKNKDGERESDFINLVLWGTQAENFANWLKKGRLISVSGRIQTRNYDNQQGQRVYVTEVVVNSFYPLDRDDSNQGQGGHAGAGSAQNAVPNFQPQQNNSPFGNTNPMDISDDDLPF